MERLIDPGARGQDRVGVPEHDAPVCILSPVDRGHPKGKTTRARHDHRRIACPRSISWW